LKLRTSAIVLTRGYYVRVSDVGLYIERKESNRILHVCLIRLLRHSSTIRTSLRKEQHKHEYFNSLRSKSQPSQISFCWRTIAFNWNI